MVFYSNDPNSPGQNGSNVSETGELNGMATGGPGPGSTGGPDMVRVAFLRPEETPVPLPQINIH